MNGVEAGPAAQSPEPLANVAPLIPAEADAFENPETPLSQQAWLGAMMMNMNQVQLATESWSDELPTVPKQEPRRPVLLEEGWEKECVQFVGVAIEVAANAVLPFDVPLSEQTSGPITAQPQPSWLGVL